MILFTLLIPAILLGALIFVSKKPKATLRPIKIRVRR